MRVAISMENAPKDTSVYPTDKHLDTQYNSDEEHDSLNPKNGDNISAPQEEDIKITRTTITRTIVFKTAIYSTIPLFLGMWYGGQGPSFLDLQLISGADVEQVASYFTGASFGYIFGSLLVGVLYDRLDNKEVLVCFAFVWVGLTTGFIPLCTSYVSMLLLHIVSSFGVAIAETASTALMVELWRGDSEGAMQLWQFSFSLGAVISPLYIEPFLAPILKNGTADDTLAKQGSFGIYNAAPANRTESPPCHVSPNTSLSCEDFTITNITKDNVTRIVSPNESGLIYAYIITGLFALLFSIPFFVLWFRKIICCQSKSGDRSEEKMKRSSEVESPLTQSIGKRLPLKMYVFLTFVLCLISFLFTMLVDSLNLFVPMFVVGHLSWSKESGALIISVFSAVGTIVNLAFIFLSRKIDASMMLMASKVSLVVSVAGFVAACHLRIDSLLWVSLCTMSMALSYMYGSLMSWFDQHLIVLDGKVVSAVSISSNLGSLLGFLVYGIMMERITLMVFPYFELLLSFIICLQFILMLFFLKPYVIANYGPPHPPVNNAINERVKMVVNGDGKETMKIVLEKDFEEVDQQE